MKQLTLLPIVILFSAMFAGCLDVEVHTTVAPGGSSDRTIRIKSGKEDLSGFAFPRPDDPSWTISRTDSEKDGKREYTLFAKKHFSTPEELAREYTGRPDTTALRLTVNLNETFGWFYTYYDYREVYHFNNPYGSTPITSVMSAQEVERFMHGDDAPELKTKYDEWELREKFEAVFSNLLDVVAARADGATITAALRERKETLFQKALHEGDKDSTGKSAKTEKSKTTASDSLKDSDLTGYILRELFESTGLDVMNHLTKEVEEAIARNSEKDRKWESLGDGYTSGVELPGLLLDSNSDDVKGTAMTWKFSNKQIRVGDVVMHGSSKVLNLWAFLVTGLGVLVLIALSAYSFMRRKE